MADDTPPAGPDIHAEAAAEMAGDGRIAVDGYDLVNNVASGNATQVWEVLERTTQQTHAMKLLLPEVVADKTQINILKHESKVGADLNHPSVIRVGKFIKSKTHAYLLMDLFKHPNLKSARKADAAGTLSRVQKIVEGVCQGLGHMHEKGWLHLDVKPDNLLVAPDGDVRVIDFSLSTKQKGGLGAMFGGRPKEIRGTRTYIAPETLLKKAPTPLTDVYSLGVTLFELLTGRPPFSGSDPNALLRAHVKEPAPPASAFNENLTADADKFLSRMLSKKPETRHQSMTEVYAEFRGLEVFKQDPVARREELKKKAAEDSLDTASRLDSRADAVRSEKGIKPPPKPPKPKPRRQSRDSVKQRPAPAGGPPQGRPNAPPQFAPAMGQFPQGQFSQGQFPPGQAPPGYYPQPQFPPGRFPPGQYPQGQYPPPQFPQGQPPPGYLPGGQAPQGRPPQGTPAPGDGPVQVPGLTRPTDNQHASQKRAEAEGEDLPLMTELPDIM